MTLSIIIINYNTFQLTCNCILAVIEKTKEVDYEIILIDNASKECDPEKFKQHFPKIKLIKSNTNLGFAGGNNLGLQTAKGEYILLLNSDTELKNNAIDLAIQKLESDNKIGALSSKLRYPDGHLQYPANRFPNLKTEIKELFRLNKFLSKQQRAEIFLGNEFDHLTERECDWIWGTFFLTRRDIIDKLGGKLPDDFFMYAEDMQWCWKIKNLGYKIFYFSDAEVIHHLAASSEIADENIRFYSKMLPNIFKTVAMQKGKLYATCLFLTKAMVHFSILNKRDFAKGKLILKTI